MERGWVFGPGGVLTMGERSTRATAQEEPLSEELRKPKAKRRPRQEMPEQSAESRMESFDEVPFGLTPELARRPRDARVRHEFQQTAPPA